MAIRVKRVREPPSPHDGMRVLVDRYWPRGMSKDRVKLDAWMKELAPSRELISWFGHQTDRWEEFKRRYQEELDHNERARADLDQLQRRAQSAPVTLLFDARDEEHNNAVALAEYLRNGGDIRASHT